MASSERHYFQRRALQEIEGAIRANSIEAELAHAGLAGLHLRRCAACETGRTSECRACPLVHVCDYPNEGDGARSPDWQGAFRHQQPDMAGR